MSFKQGFISRICATLLLCSVGGIGLAEPSLNLPGIRVHEDLRGEALISGNWLVGAHTVAPRTEVAPRLLSNIPGGSDWQGQTLCARATDKSGRYSALFEYKLPGDWAGGLVNLRYQSDFKEFVEATDDNNSGVALHLGECRTVTDTFLPVHWNSQEDPTVNADGQVEMVLNLNMGRADSLIAKAVLTRADNADQSPAPIDCQPTNTIGVGFNYQCRLLVPSTFTGVAEINLVRLRYGKKSPPRIARLQLYASEPE